jgi:PadR family transcriptional regulator, regulatory protein PadR
MPLPSRRKPLPQLTSSLEEDIVTVVCGKRLYGIEIQKALEEVFEEKKSAGSLYPALHRLAKKGFLSAEWGDPDHQYEGARRKYYTVTALGREVLNSNRERRSLLANWSPPPVLIPQS